MSSDKPTTLLAFIPALGTNSNSVTIGPDLKFTILPSTPYSKGYFQALKTIPHLTFGFLLFGSFL